MLKNDSYVLNVLLAIKQSYNQDWLKKSFSWVSCRSPLDFH